MCRGYEPDLRRMGQEKLGGVTGTPIIRYGKILGLIAAVRDVTERKRMEEVMNDK